MTYNMFDESSEAWWDRVHMLNRIMDSTPAAVLAAKLQLETPYEMYLRWLRAQSMVS